ncbi:universal stress protein UspA [Trinickia symbiotica]|uniref:Universal stress protein UspA n=1 Tax=Trinickia symbiotica TaxID=863227 RepID=A0A2T3XK08_9BURK|nr:universal stress protein [Trinickia symbiotica]PTB16851.1 universal stress protein UspA [Trinickia symbiotica]
MYKRILVPVDGSEGAMHALDKAIELARSLHAEVQAVFVLVHPAQLVDIGGAYVEEMPPTDTTSRTATSVLDEARERFARAGVVGSVRAIDSYGDSIVAVLRRGIDEFSADLVVMYSHGRRGFRRLLAGSVAESLLRDTTIPLLLLRDITEEEEGAAS